MNAMKDVYRMAKGEACRMFESAQGTEAEGFWAKRIAWLDKKLKAQPSNQPSKIRRFRRFKRFKLMIWIINIAVILSIITGCETVKGTGRDVEWLGGAGQKFLEYRK